MVICIEFISNYIHYKTKNNRELTTYYRKQHNQHIIKITTVFYNLNAAKTAQYKKMKVTVREITISNMM